MNHGGHRRRQQGVLRAVMALCREDAHVLAVTVAGSFARGENGAFSDLDMECYWVARASTAADTKAVGRSAPGALGSLP